MIKGILELAEKIYNEGVERAKLEAELIISNAKIEADKIIVLAKNEEEIIIEQAERKAFQFKRNSDAEIRLAARKFISKLKQQIAELITVSQTESIVKEEFMNNNFVKQIILTIVKNWNPQKPEELDIKLLL